MRLIDADKVLGVLRELDTRSFSGTMYIKNFMCLINEQPTVYDVDNVLKQLEDEKSHMSLLDDELEIYKSAINDAIEIVKAGGNIELSEHSKSQGNRTGK